MKVGDLVVMTTRCWKNQREHVASYTGVIREIREDRFETRYNVYFASPPSDAWNYHFWSVSYLKRVKE